jgi:hypothetical protein
VIWLAVLLAGNPAADREVTHPSISCWSGQRSWTADGEPPSQTILFRTEGDPLAVSIEHHRDQLRTETELDNDFNFLDYKFAARPAMSARVFLEEPATVLVHFSDGIAPSSLKALRRATGDEILCYLQKRFRQIEVFRADKGYRPVWRAE